jgi:hypothetical protein
MSNWKVVTTSSPSITLPAEGDGDYEFEVVAIDAFGNRSSITTGSQSVSSKTTGGVIEGEGIESVKGLSFEVLGSNRLLARWSPPEASNLSLAIRHSPERNAVWGSANPLQGDRTWLADAGSAELPLLEGAYLLRYVDGAGESSANTQSRWLEDSGDPSLEMIASVSEGYEFSGSKDNVMNDSTEKGLSLFFQKWDDLPSLSLTNPIDSYGLRIVDTRLWDDLENIDFLTSPIDSYGVDSRYGSYLLSQEVILETAKAVEIQREINSRCIFRETLWDRFEGLVDEIPSIWGPPEAGYVQMDFRSRPSPTSQWSEWSPLTRTKAYGQAFQFRAILFGGDINQDVVVTRLKAKIFALATLTPEEKQVSISCNVPPGATATGVITLPKKCTLISIQANAPIWFRLYSSMAAQNLDVNRLLKTPPARAAGVIADPVFTQASTMQLEPVLHVVNRETPRSENFPYRLTNNGSASSILITMTYYQV